MGVGAILTLLLFAADAPEAQSLSDAQLADRAATAFAEGRHQRDDGKNGKKEFEAAAALYEQLRQRGVSNPALYRNLGHSYVLAENLPHAILTLRRGARLWPHDADLQTSLAEARALVVYANDRPLGHGPVEQSPWYLSPLAARTWLVAAFVLYTTACVSATRWWMTRRSWLLAVCLGCLLVAPLPTASLTWFLMDADHRHRAETANTLVVINDDGVLLRKGDSLNYPARYDTPLNRGVEARLVRERGAWVQIELAGGEVGWVARRFVLIDRPDAD